MAVKMAEMVVIQDRAKRGKMWRTSASSGAEGKNRKNEGFVGRQNFGDDLGGVYGVLSFPKKRRFVAFATRAQTASPTWARFS